MSKSRISLFLSFFYLASLQAQPVPDSGSNSTSALSFQNVFERVLDSDPRLSVLEYRLEEADGLLEQASLRPNPALEAEVENILGTGPFDALDAAETTVTYAQELETGGKRRLRSAVAEGEREALRIDLDSLRLEILSETRAAFDRTVLAQRRVDLRKNQLELAEASRAEVQKLLESARASSVETARAELAVREQTFALRQAEREAQSAREALIALWNPDGASAFRVTDDLSVAEPPPLEDLLSGIATLPGLRRLEKEYQTRQTEVELEEALGKPNVEVFGGVKHTNEDDGDMAFLVGVGLPLPLFDRNQGNIRAAKARMEVLQAEQQTLQRQIRLELSAAWREAASTHADVTELQTRLLPAAEEALNQTEAGYEAARYPLLNVLESRQALFDIREAELEALERYLSARAVLERLTGTPLTPTR